MNRIVAIIFALLLAQGDTEEPPRPVPFTRNDHVTVQAVLERYPEIAANLPPPKLAKKINTIPDELKNQLRLSLLSYVDGRVHYECFNDGGWWPVDHDSKLLKSFLEKHGRDNGVKDCYFVLFAKDELVSLWL